MSDSVRITIYTAISALVIITGIWKIVENYNATKTKPSSFTENPVTICCISESGDTVARYRSLKPPKIWSEGDVMCAYDFIDLDTGMNVEIRTRTGTIVVCQ